MANRHLSRSIALQTLFEWDFNGATNNDLVPIVRRNEAEFGPGLDDSTFIESLIDLVIKKKAIIDEIIEKAAPDWPLDKINTVDRNILRLGLAELLFGDRNEVPPKVAINEAIELAKSFGGETSGRFVNGVLGAVYKEIGEPGKDEVGKKQKKVFAETDPAKFPIEKKAGAVVYAKHEGKIYFAFVHDVFGYWTLSKSGPRDGETIEQAAKRAIQEEMGLEITIKEQIGANEYIASHPEKGKIRKQVTFFLAESPYVPVMFKSESGGLDGAEWFSIEELPNLKMYDDVVGFCAQAIEKITSSAQG